jgi:AcrR family transcriptional regulator
MFDTEIDVKEQVTEARRTQILMGAAQVFADKGYHKATTKEIAKAAGVSEGTIYNYFGNKRELLLAMVEVVAGQSLKTLIADHQSDDPREFFLAIMRDRYALAGQRGNVIAPIFAEIFTDAELRDEVYNRIARPLGAIIETYLQNHIDAGRMRPIDPLVVTRAFLGAMILNSAIKLTNLDDRYQGISEEMMFEQLASLFLDGLLFNSE